MKKCWCGNKAEYIHKVMKDIGTVSERTELEFHCWDHVEDLWESVKVDPDSRIIGRYTKEELKIADVMES